MSFVPLSWHARVAPTLAAALSGAESCAIIGVPGTGKSDLLTDAVAQRNAAVPDSAVIKVVGRLHAPARLLECLLEWLGAPPGSRLSRRGATALFPEVAKRIAATGTTTFVLDEAHHASADAIVHALLVRDECWNEFQHQVAFVLCGTKELVDVLHATDQRGQRIPVVLSTPLLDAVEIESLVPSVAPEISACLRQAAKAPRESLMGELIDAVDGSIRRLDSINRRAVFLAAGGAVTQAHVRAAIALQAP